MLIAQFEKIEYLVKCIPTGQTTQPYVIFQELTKHYSLDGWDPAVAFFGKKLTQVYFDILNLDFVTRFKIHMPVESTKWPYKL